MENELLSRPLERVILEKLMVLRLEMLAPNVLGVLEQAHALKSVVAEILVNRLIQQRLEYFHEVIRALRLLFQNEFLEFDENAKSGWRHDKCYAVHVVGIEAGEAWAREYRLRLIVR